MRISQSERGRDLLQYAWMAGFVAVAAGVIAPGISDDLSSVFAKFVSIVAGAAARTN